MLAYGEPYSNSIVNMLLSIISKWYFPDSWLLNNSQVIESKWAVHFKSTKQNKQNDKRARYIEITAVKRVLGTNCSSMCKVINIEIEPGLCLYPFNQSKRKKWYFWRIPSHNPYWIWWISLSDYGHDCGHCRDRTCCWFMFTISRTKTYQSHRGHILIPATLNHHCLFIQGFKFV